jgi:hypothetical protein
MIEEYLYVQDISCTLQDGDSQLESGSLMVGAQAISADSPVLIRGSASVSLSSLPALSVELADECSQWLLAVSLLSKARQCGYLMVSACSRRGDSPQSSRVSGLPNHLLLTT